MSNTKNTTPETATYTYTIHAVDELGQMTREEGTVQADSESAALDAWAREMGYDDAETMHAETVARCVAVQSDYAHYISAAQELIDYHGSCDSIGGYMDDDLREQIHSAMPIDTDDVTWLAHYLAAHHDRFGVELVIN